MKNKIWIGSLWCIGGLFFLSGCTTHEMLIPSVGLGDLHFEALDDSEYRILDNVKGTARGGRILIFLYGDARGVPKSGSFYPPTSSVLSLGSFRFSLLGQILFSADGTDPYVRMGIDPEVAAAMYDAIENSPNADSLILPKVKKTTFQAFFWSNYEVEVEGKAIEITKDAP